MFKQWNTPSGATFAMTLTVAMLTALNWLTDGRAADRTRLTVVETQMSFILPALTHIQKTLDEIKNGR